MTVDIASCPSPSVCAPDPVDTNVLLAFGLTIIAGLATVFGALAPFIKFVNLENKLFLAGGLAASAGVMLYVSFVEIFMVSTLNSFCCITEKYTAAATATFFGGMVFTILLHYFVHGIEQLDSVAVRSRVRLAVSRCNPISRYRSKRDAPTTDEEKDNECIEKTCPIDEYEHGNADDDMELQKLERDEIASGGVVTIDNESFMLISPAHMNIKRRKSYREAVPVDIEQEESAPDAEKVKLSLDEHEAKKLKRMGLMTAIAIGIHNIPEGIATFFGTLSDTNLGVALSVAIALHNIPEGLCVVMPVYYATGSKMQAFLWALLSGLSEPLGALIAYAFMGSTVSPTTYGVLFGLVGGMMVYICLKELIPTALRYDPENRVVTKCIVGGMFFMSVSLVVLSEFE